MAMANQGCGPAVVAVGAEVMVDRRRNKGERGEGGLRDHPLPSTNSAVTIVELK